jgi:uncharacterized protein
MNLFTHRIAPLVLAVFCMTCNNRNENIKDYPIQPVPAGDVTLSDNFWKPRMDINSRVTVPFGFEMCESTGRIDNFRIAGGLKEGEYKTVFPFDDSDVFKIIEGASYILEQEYDPSLDNYLDSLIHYIGTAQEADGYLYTWRTIDPSKPGADWWGGPERWSNIRDAHELYNAGHLYEAATAHFLATGKRSLLEIALKNAELIAGTFGPGRRIDPPGHEEIEIGLVKLYRVTGNRQHLELARFFVDQRGRNAGRETWGEYYQDHLPVRDQRTAVGHAVRAGYLYTAMADLSALTGDQSYLTSLDNIWNDIVSTKLYITGGLGASRSGEAFGAGYELPNAEAYAETCAAIASVFWNHRMFLLEGDGKYYDVMERALYNGLLSGVSLSGDRFFYPNPLFSDGNTAFNYGTATRQEWFPCACCPSNISRFMPSIPGYFYSTKNDTLFVNLYASGKAEALNGHLDLQIKQVTDYPWAGKISINVASRKSGKYLVALRIPGWAVNQPVPSDLYTFTDMAENPPEISLNGERLPFKPHRGYVFIELRGKKEQTIDLFLPLKIMKVRSHPELKANGGRIALQFGPLVYCFEEADNGPDIERIRIRQNSSLKTTQSQNFKGITEIRISVGDSVFTAIPYHLWSNRGENEMAVWIREE